MSAIVALLGGWRASLFALIAVLALAFAGVQTLRLARSDAALADTEAKAAAAIVAASEAARLEEQTRARYIAGVGDAYERGKTDALRPVAGVLAAVARGDYVLRKSLQCPASAASATAAGPGVGDGPAASAGGLAGEDVQFLVRFAGDAELVSEQLRACQAVIRADRAVIP